jgi:cell division transport system permease protein
MMFSLRYFFMRAFKNMKGNLFPNLTTIGIITLSMLIFSTFSLIAFNLSSYLKIWEDKIEIIAYLKKNTAPGDVEDLLRNTRLLHGVDVVKHVSSSDAFAFMESKLGSQKNLLEGIQPTVLPASFEIQLKKEFRNSTRIKEVVSQLKQFSQIEEIQYGREWVETFSVIVHILRITQWILGALLLAAMTFIIANTLQLTIATRHEEIEIMHLVGASPAFIQVPFYLEGIIQGLLGAVLALLSLFFLYKIFLLQIPPSVREWMVGIPLFFLPPRTVASFLTGGMVLGFFGSFVASIRILKYSG